MVLPRCKDFIQVTQVDGIGGNEEKFKPKLLNIWYIKYISFLDPVYICMTGGFGLNVKESAKELISLIQDAQK